MQVKRISVSPSVVDQKIDLQPLVLALAGRAATADGEIVQIVGSVQRPTPRADEAYIDRLGPV